MTVTDRDSDTRRTSAWGAAAALLVLLVAAVLLVPSQARMAEARERCEAAGSTFVASDPGVAGYCDESRPLAVP